MDQKCRRCGQAAYAYWRTYQHDAAGLAKTALAAVLRVRYSEAQAYDVPVCERCYTVLRFEDLVPWTPTVLATGLFVASNFLRLPVGLFIAATIGWMPLSILLLLWRARRHPLRQRGTGADRLRAMRDLPATRERDPLT